MQQHRVICTNAFNEPAVGVVYLTNFRIIFNGSPISVSITMYPTECLLLIMTIQKGNNLYIMYIIIIITFKCLAMCSFCSSKIDNTELLENRNDFYS